MDTARCTRLLESIFARIREPRPPRPPPLEEPDDPELKKRIAAAQALWEMRQRERNPHYDAQREALQHIVAHVGIPPGWVADYSTSYMGWTVKLHPTAPAPRPFALAAFGNEHFPAMTVMTVYDGDLGGDIFHWSDRQPAPGAVPAEEFKCVLHAVAQSWAAARARIR